MLRWHCPQRGDVPPAIFIPIAEETGLIGPLGEWLLCAACRAAAMWPAPMHVMVDVSPLQLRLPGFTDSVRAALAESGLDPSRLAVKLTEGILHHDAGLNTDPFHALRGLGATLVLDYSDTGHTSLGALRRFHFDKIKIGRSFVNGACHDPAAAAIVGAVAGLGRTLGTPIIADGVETEEDAVLLRSLGCTRGQGALFFPPLDADAMLAMTLTQQPASRVRDSALVG
jgi:EAL domain-containing protein (putative c-di-GMP-specific phosphodiesterase class I)